MAEALRAAIIVAGAGPVGMSLAIDAAMRGLDVIVVEARRAGEPPSTKCNTVAARTLEIFRRFGMADKVRAAGLPDDYPTDIIYASSLSGPEFTRIAMPSRSERDKPGYIDSDWRTPEPMVRVSQIYLEPILLRRMLELPNIRLLNETMVEGYRQTDDGVVVACSREGGETFEIHGRFLAGCDGGRSVIRKTMGVGLSGDAVISRTRSTLVRSADLRKLFGARRPAWMSWIVNHKAQGNVVAIDGEEVWLIHRAVRGDMPFEQLDFDQSIRDVLGVGPDFKYEVLHHEDWTGRRLVADRFRDGNVFIAGDAAHLWVPYAGYGMNAGIADATNLSFALSGVAQGWADPGLLDAYEAERQPITEQVSRHAIAKVMENAAALGAGGAPPAILSNRGPVAAIVRFLLGRKLYRINVPQFAPSGLNFGYYYDASPIIAYDGEKAPAYTMGETTPSTAPGCRMPHFWLGKNVSVYDRLSPDYTLVRFDPRADAQTLIDAAKAAGLPLTLLDIDPKLAPASIAQKLLIVRGDQHVAWRGDAAPAPADAQRLVSRLRGVRQDRAAAA